MRAPFLLLSLLGATALGAQEPTPPTAVSEPAPRAGGESVMFGVPATASWDDYQTQAVGGLNLSAGEQRLTIQPASRPLPALMDLKSVVLERVKVAALPRWVIGDTAPARFRARGACPERAALQRCKSKGLRLPEDVPGPNR